MRVAFTLLLSSSELIGLNPSRQNVEVEIELYGIPRHRFGAPKATVKVPGDPFTLHQVIQALVAQCPELSQDAELLGSRFRSMIACINDDTFLSSPNDMIRGSDHVMLLSADAGG